MKNNNKRDTKRAATINIVAEIGEVSTRSVRRIVDGEQDNPKVLGVFMEITEGINSLIENTRNNLLLEEVKRIVPFN